MILVPVAAASVNAAHRQVRVAEKAKADGVELRLDALKRPKAGEVAALVRSVRIPVLATCRPKKEGGFLTKTPQQRQALLLEAVAGGAALVDVELSAPTTLKKAVRKAAKKAGCTLVVSAHDFQKTPEPKILQAWANKALRQGDIAKIVCLAKNTVDNLRLLELIQEHPGKVVAFGMGQEGQQSRVISLLYGAPFGFASLSKKSAPGQLSLEKMRLALSATKNLVES